VQRPKLTHTPGVPLQGTFPQEIDRSKKGLRERKGDPKYWRWRTVAVSYYKESGERTISGWSQFYPDLVRMGVRGQIGKHCSINLQPVRIRGPEDKR